MRAFALFTLAALAFSILVGVIEAFWERREQQPWRENTNPLLSYLPLTGRAATEAAISSGVSKRCLRMPTGNHAGRPQIKKCFLNLWIAQGEGQVVDVVGRQQAEAGVPMRGVVPHFRSKP